MKLEKALAKHKWHTVLKLLQQGLNDTQRAWAVEEAIRHAKNSHLETILPHCTDEQLEGALETAVVRGLWSTVLVFLQRKVAGVKRAWALEEAIRHADDENLKNILPLCADNQLQLALETSVTRRLWHAVPRLLERNVDTETQGRVVEEAIRWLADEEQGKEILPRCTVEQLDIVLRKAVKRRWWGCVTKLFRRELSNEMRQWAVEQAREHTKDEDFDTFVRQNHDHLDVEQRNAVFTELVTRGMWGCVVNLMHKTSFTDEQKSLVVYEACKADAGHVVLEVVHNVRDRDFVDSVLPHLIRFRQWVALTELMPDKVSEKQRKRIIMKAIKHAAEKDLRTLLMHCPDSLLDFAVSEAVQRKHWCTVSDLLDDKKDLISREVQIIAVEEAICHAGEEEFRALTQRGTGGLLGSVVSNVVSRQLWDVIEGWLLHGMKTQHVQFLLEEVSKHSSERNLMGIMRQLARRSIRLDRELRNAGAKCTPVCLFCNEIRTWAIEEAIESARSNKLHLQLSSPRGFRLDSVLTNAVRRSMWGAVAYILDCGVDDEMCAWAVKETPETMVSLDFHCVYNQVPFVRTVVAKRDILRLNRVLMNTRLNRLFWALEEASQYASDRELFRILHCSMTAGFLYSGLVLRNAVTRRMWKCVMYILRRYVVPVHDKRWALEEASKHTTDAELHILLYSAHIPEMSFILPTVFRREMWNCVNYILDSAAITTHGERWHFDVTSESLIRVNLRDILHDFVEKYELDFILSELVRRKMWITVRYMLRANLVTYPQKIWVFREASNHATDKELSDLLVYCQDGQLESLLRTVVERNLWSCMGYIMCRCDVVAHLRRWALSKATKHAPKDVLFSLVRQHCADHELGLLDEIVSTSRPECLFGFLQLKRERFTTNDHRPSMPLREKLAQNVINMIYDSRLDEIAMRALCLGALCAVLCAVFAAFIHLE